MPPYGSLVKGVVFMYFRRIEDLRIDNDKTQQEIANYLDCSRESYRKYEHGTREIPVWAVIKLAELYKTSTDYLLGRTDHSTPYKSGNHGVKKNIKSPP
jgi:transcriptional regulator with XRE-family HTH domain